MLTLKVKLLPHIKSSLPFETKPSLAFGIPGVKEHAHFLKDVKDARAIRARILECTPVQVHLRKAQSFIGNLILGFEQANQPVLSDIERRNILNFCVVGASIFPFAYCHLGHS